MALHADSLKASCLPLNARCKIVVTCTVHAFLSTPVDMDARGLSM
jgi:hypothetical protein